MNCRYDFVKALDVNTPYVYHFDMLVWFPLPDE